MPVMVRSPVRRPGSVGAKLTLNWQVLICPAVGAEMGPLHRFVPKFWKSPAGPDLRFTAAVIMNHRFCAVLLLPTPVSGKPRPWLRMRTMLLLVSAT